MSVEKQIQREIKHYYLLQRWPKVSLSHLRNMAYASMKSTSLTREGPQVLTRRLEWKLYGDYKLSTHISNMKELAAEVEPFKELQLKYFRSKTLRGSTGNFFIKINFYGKIWNIYESTRILLATSNMRLALTHAVFFNAKLAKEWLKNIQSMSSSKNHLPSSLVSGSGRIEKCEALHRFKGMVNIKFHSMVAVFYLWNNF